MTWLWLETSQIDLACVKLSFLSLLNLRTRGTSGRPIVDEGKR